MRLLYRQDSESVPTYYSRPGPGNYEIDQGLGKRTGVAGSTNGPSWGIKAPSAESTSIAQFKVDRLIAHQSHQRSLSRGDDNYSSERQIERLEPNDVALHRFVDFAVDMKTKQKQLQMLKPSLLQTSKNTSK